MAKVLGESARYTSQEAVNEHGRVMLHCFIVVAILCALEGACIASFVPLRIFPAWVRVLVFPSIGLAGVWYLKSWGFKRLCTLEKDRAKMRRGASGEIQVGFILSDFPEDFYVINDLTTSFGNLDHVVIGPTGVFVLDTKNCRGVITADHNGEILVNGKKEKDQVRPFVKRMMDVRDKVRVLAPESDQFYHAVLVFTAAWVDAKWGSTGNANCIRDNQLYDYIVESKSDKRLSRKEVKQIAQAFLSLAQMDEAFDRGSVEPHSPQVPQKTLTVENARITAG